MGKSIIGIGQSNGINSYSRPIHGNATISTISEQTYNEAARIKGIYRKLSLADSVGIATAVELGAIFVTSDHHELKDIAEKEASFKFFWFR